MDSTEKDKPSANSGEEMESDPCPPQSSTESADVNKTAEDIENTDSKELQTETTHDKPAPSDQEILTDEAESAVVHSNKENSKDEKPSIVTNPEEIPPLSGSQETGPPFSFNIQSDLEKENTDSKELQTTHDKTAPSDQDILTDEAESAVAHSNKENSKDEKPSIVTNPEETPPLSGSQETEPPLSFNIQSALEKEELVDHIRGAIYGNCIGDAIGLLTEFMSKSEAANIYADHDQNKGLLGKLKDRLQSSSQRRASLEYDMKYADFHRCRWETGDWTDDSDQMILILLSLLDNKGKMVPKDFARKMKKWSREGFPELGDKGGMGIGRTTYGVLRHPDFQTDPHHAAEYVWEASGRFVAPNGGVMRTSILGVHDFGNIETVIANTKAACKVTHADPRCIASCVAVTTAIAMMLQGKHFVKESKSYDVKAVMKDAYEYARDIFETVEEEKELEDHMFAKSLDDLQLDGEGKIGYTFKCLGAGFWSLRQDDFRASLEAVTFEAGDADTNGAVAGALLGCKLGASKLPESWLSGLKHKKWLDVHIDNFLALLGLKD